MPLQFLVIFLLFHFMILKANHLSNRSVIHRECLKSGVKSVRVIWAHSWHSNDNLWYDYLSRNTKLFTVPGNPKFPSCTYVVVTVGTVIVGVIIVVIARAFILKAKCSTVFRTQSNIHPLLSTLRSIIKVEGSFN